MTLKRENPTSCPESSRFTARSLMQCKFPISSRFSWHDALEWLSETPCKRRPEELHGAGLGMENKQRSPENGKSFAWTCPRVLHYLSRIVGLCHNRAEFTGFRFKHKRLFLNIVVSTDYVFLELLYETVQLVRVDHVHSDLRVFECVFLSCQGVHERIFGDQCVLSRPKGKRASFRLTWGLHASIACRYWQNEYYCHVLGAGHWTHGHHFLWLLLNQWKNDTSWYPTSCGCTAAWRNST
jgi:hypothetical protein